jgi:teichuronic acid exporter
MAQDQKMTQSQLSTGSVGSVVDAPLTTGSVLSSADKRNLDRSLVKGVAWTGGVKWVSQVVAWASSLLVARLLSPEDYGLVGMAAVYMGFVSLLNEFGLGAAVVVQRKLTDEQVKQLNAFSVLLGLALFGISCALSMPLAVFFKTAHLRWVVMAMSTAFVVSSFQTIPNALLQRDLRFKTLAFIEGAQAIIQALSTLVFALIGMGYWTLVLGGLVGTVTLTLLVCAQRMQPFAWPRIRDIKHALNFSTDVVIGKVSWYVASNTDFLVAGRILGKVALGTYSFAWTLANIPLDRISALVNRVLPSIFSAVQSELASMRRYLLTITEGLALISFPIAFGCALVSDDLVLLLLGAKWSGVILPLRLLSAYAAFRSIYTFIPYVLFNSGHVRFWKWNSVVSAVVLPLSFYLGSYWGTGGIAGAWIVIHPLVALPSCWRAFKTIELPWLDYFRSIWPALSGSALMLAVVVAVKLLIVSSWSLPLRLGTEVLAGGSAYAFTLLAFHRARLASFYAVLRDVRERKSTSRGIK